MKEIELIKKRKSNEKHFLQEDGTIKAKIYESDVHYLKDGEYIEIDNTLLEKDDEYINKNNDYKVHFRKNIKDSLMKMEKDNYYLEMKLKQFEKEKTKKKGEVRSSVDKIFYNNILDGIDIEYITLSNKVKETIVLHHNQIKNIDFLIKTNLQLEIQNGSIIAKDADKTIFIIEKPFMLDSNGVRNDNIYYEVALENNEYSINLILDEEWLKSSKTLFPVYIDPTIVNSNQINSVYDTYIYPGDNGVDKNSLSYLKIGVEKVNNDYIKNRALLKFDLPDIGTSSEIINAELILQTCYGNEGNNTEKTLEIHRVTTDWTEETANWESMNNNYDERVETLQFLQRRQRVTEYELDENGNPIDVSYDINMYSQMYNDITDLVKHWYKDTPNNGIMIKSNPEIYIDDNYPMIYSKNNTISEELKPLLVITYRSQNGLESYLNYKTQSFTDGNTFLNTYNGNLVGVFNIGNTISNKLPVNIDLIYNTNDVITKNNGFKFSLNQTIEIVDIDNNQYLEYEDEDGTNHYFYQATENTTKYYDEDGLELTIEKNDNYCYMTDKYGNKKIFTKKSNGIYYLTKIENINLDFINITLDSNNRITNISDANNLTISIDYLNDQTIITSPDRVTTLNYNGNNITSIVTLNGTTIFTYNSNNLIASITDITGLKINYEYYEQKPYRIKRIEQYGLNNKLGNYFTVEYGFNSTSFTDNKGKINTLIFNSIGNLLSSNTMPTVEDISNAYSTSTEYNDSEINKNKLLDSTIPIKYVKNYLFNTNSESDNQKFGAEYPQGVYVGYSTEHSHSGTQSVVIQFYSIGIGTPVYNGFWTVPAGKYYTFSGYFKNDKKIKIGLEGSDGTVCYEEIEPSEEFVRHDVSYYLNENSDGRIAVVITSDEEATIYVDDVQLEEGEVANNYNCIDNSDFAYGLSGWEVEATKDDYTNLDEYGFPQTVNVDTSEVFQVVNFNDGKNTALQINMNPIGRSSLRKTFAIKGKKGDVYDISFWMKNEGLVGNEFYVGNTVMIYFKPVGHDAEYCILASPDFVPNSKWQYYSYKYSAEEDYESISIVFNQGRQANKMLITNLTFYKDLNTNYYDYDQNGNLISITNSDGRSNMFEYNKSNQLISSTTPRGKNFKYEYDNTKVDLIQSAISSMGISNKYKYDSNNNPISTIISKKGIEELTNGNYKIRSKGTEKYIKAEYNIVLMEENSCSNTIWKLEKIDDSFKIINLLNPTFSLAYSNNSIILSTDSNNNLFILEENDNGSYYIKSSAENKYLRANNFSLELVTLVDDDYNFEFYFENIPEKFIESDATYTEDGRFITSITDSLFNKTIYNNDSTTGLLTSITNANNQTINYTYNDKYQIASIMQGDRIITYSYNEQNLLNQITQGDKIYKFIYDDFLNCSQVKIGDNITLLTNEYEDNNGNLLKTTYGNGNIVSYEYDEFDRIKKMHTADKDYTYLYDSNGNIAKILMNNLILMYDLPPTENEKWYDSIEKYKYDNAKRIYEYINDQFRINYMYDNNDNIINKNYKLNAYNNTIQNTFDKDDMLIRSLFDTVEFNYYYDELGRLNNSDINNNYHTEYKYVSLGKRTSILVESIKNGNEQYTYKYNNLNDVTDIYKNGELIKKYYYDNYNELIKEEDYNTKQRCEYSYDNYGNLLTKTTTNMETNDIISTDTYQYSNTNWLDQLTKYNDKNITYDNIGNPISIGNNIILSWINGRSLYTYEDTDKDLEVIYQYNMDGIRTSKVVNGIETKYHLENDSIIYENRNNNIIYYMYNETGIIGLQYNGNNYYYIKNLQNDIVGILDSSYNKVVLYEYDSWGKLLSIKDNEGNIITDNNNIGIINPFRYRSYYYDSETELYYLNSRYYNPEWSRFLNADGLIGASDNYIGYNLYAYACNNPINYSDYTGEFFKKAWNWVKNKAKSLYNSAKKEMKKLLNNVSKTINAIKDSFVIDVGVGTGAETKGKTSKTPIFNGGKENNITYQQNEFTCSTTTTKGMEFPGLKIGEDTTVETSCYDHEPIGEPETVGTLILGPVTLETDGDVFFGINLEFSFIVSGHLKIGWDIPNKKNKKMPGPNNSNITLY